MSFFWIWRRGSPRRCSISTSVPLLHPAQKLKVTQRDVSQLIGISRESTNKQLRSWQRRKWIKLERGGMTILAPNALRRLVNENGSEDK